MVLLLMNCLVYALYPHVMSYNWQFLVSNAKIRQYSYITN